MQDRPPVLKDVDKGWATLSGRILPEVSRRILENYQRIDYGERLKMSGLALTRLKHTNPILARFIEEQSEQSDTGNSSAVNVPRVRELCMVVYHALNTNSNSWHVPTITVDDINILRRDRESKHSLAQVEFDRERKTEGATSTINPITPYISDILSEIGYENPPVHKLLDSCGYFSQDGEHVVARFSGDNSPIVRANAKISGALVYKLIRTHDETRIFEEWSRLQIRDQRRKQ